MKRSRMSKLACAAGLAVLAAAACSGKVLVENPGGDGGAGAQGGAGGTLVTSTSTTVVTSTVVSTTDTSPGTVMLGLPCQYDFECGGDGTCLTVSSNSPVLGGGPANGYCSKACSSDGDCAAASGVCVVGPDGQGECFLSCEIGAPELMYLNDPLDPDKCYGREDVRCQDLGLDSAVCVPTCGSDAQCAGRFCDPQHAVCVDSPTEGKPLGDKCDPMGVDPECAGLCIAFAQGQSMCTSPCVMGGELPNELECFGSGAGVCLYAPSGTGLGDVGFCAEVCSAQDHCQVPDFWCFDIGLGDNGVCLTSNTCVSDADCAQGDPPSVACIDTPLGKYCMSPQYPLGNL